MATELHASILIPFDAHGCRLVSLSPDSGGEANIAQVREGPRGDTQSTFPAPLQEPIK